MCIALLGLDSLVDHASREREDKMNLYQMWYAVAANWFNGVTQVLVLEQFAVAATIVTVVGLVLVPLRLLGGRR